MNVKPQKKLSKFRAVDWQTLEDYKLCMSPIAKALDILQSEKCIDKGLGYVLPTLYSIKKKISSLNTSSNSGNEFKRAILSSISKRFDDIMNFTEENKYLIVASVSHPKFKLNWIENHTHKEIARKIFIDECIEIYKTIGEEELVSASNINVNDDDFFENFERRTDQRRSSTELNIPSLEAIGFINDANGTLSSLKSYRIVEYVFRMYNTTLTSSAPVERLFSNALIIFTPRRNRLSGGNFEKALFVNKNFSLFE